MLDYIHLNEKHRNIVKEKIHSVQKDNLLIHIYLSILGCPNCKYLKKILKKWDDILCYALKK